MGQIVITINTDNAAFDGQHDTAHEVARILRQYATDSIANEQVEDTKLRDINGNTVGEVKVYESVEA